MNFYHFVQFTVGKPELIIKTMFPRVDDSLSLILSVMLSAESKFTHIQEVLHQRLLGPPLKDKTKVPLFQPLPSPSPLP